MDAITLLKEDHRAVEKLFKRFEKAGPGAYVEKRKVVDSIIEELSIHAAVEELLFYPVTRATVPEVEDTALESIEEHHIVKWVLSELQRLDPRDERFVAKVTVLIENVRHHIAEEEDDYFPTVRDALGRKALTELGDAMVDAKKGLPTHPHPRSPQTPPANVVVGGLAGVIDRLSDTVSGAAQGGAAALQDVINKVTGARTAPSSPTGSTTARRTAAKVRRTAATKAKPAASKARAATKRAKKRTGAATKSSSRS